MPDLTCPKCGKSLGHCYSYIGDHVVCPHCKHCFAPDAEDVEGDVENDRAVDRAQNLVEHECEEKEAELERVALTMLACLVQSQEVHEPTSVVREAFDLAVAFVEERDRRVSNA